MKTFNIDDVVLIKYNGNRDVPLYLSDTKGTVVGFGRKKIKVQPHNMEDGYTINIHPEQLKKIEQ